MGPDETQWICSSAKTRRRVAWGNALDGGEGGWGAVAEGRWWKYWRGLGGMDTRILRTGLFKREFAGCLSRRPVVLRLASPFVGKTPFGSIVTLGRDLVNRGCERLQIVTRPPETGNGTIRLAEADLLIALGDEIELMIRPKLHAKVYSFSFAEGDGASFVGSANLTGGGFERNDETVAMFRGAEDNGKVVAEMDRIAGPGAFEFTHWRIMRGG